MRKNFKIDIKYYLKIPYRETIPNLPAAYRHKNSGGAVNQGSSHAY